LIYFSLQSFFLSNSFFLQKIMQTRRQSDTTPNKNNTQQQHKIHTQITLFGLLRKSRNSSATTTTTNSAAATVYCLLFPQGKAQNHKKHYGDLFLYAKSLHKLESITNSLYHTLS